MAETMTTAESFVQQFGAQKASLPGGDQPWLASLREEAIETVGRLGLPTPRVEQWKYTNLRPLERLAFTQADEDAGDASIDSVPTLLGSQAGHRAVLVNGRFRPELSSLGEIPKGASVLSLAEAIKTRAGLMEENLGRIAERHEEQTFFALNTAFMRDGIIVHVEKGAKIEDPIELVFLSVAGEEALASHPRVLILVEDGAEATVVETYRSLGDGAALTNVASEVRVGDQGRLHHYKLQDESAKTFQIHTLHSRVGKEALYDGFSLTTGGRLVRNDLHVRLEGSFSDARLNGAFLVREKQHADTTTLIQHCVPDTSCREVIKGAVDDAARSVFQGKIIVHKDAQRTDGYQLSRGLLLSDMAEMDTKPELEIYADDVKCSHGSTIGALDDTAMFYLRSRGISASRARSLLIESFLAEALEELVREDLREAFQARIRRWLDANG